MFCDCLTPPFSTAPQAQQPTHRTPLAYQLKSLWGGCWHWLGMGERVSFWKFFKASRAVFVVQVGQQINLDVISFTQAFEQVNRLVCKTMPVNRFFKRVMIQFPDFVKINKFMGLANDLNRACGIKNRFEADPGGDAFVVKSFDRSDAILRPCTSRFPFGGMLVAEKREGGSKSIGGSKQIHIAQGAASAFGEGADGVTVLVQNLDNFAGVLQLDIKGLVRVTGKAQQDLRTVAGVLLRFLLQIGQEFFRARAWVNKHLSCLLRSRWGVAVSTSMVAASVYVTGAGRIFAGLSSGFVNECHGLSCLRNLLGKARFAVCGVSVKAVFLLDRAGLSVIRGGHNAVNNGFLLFAAFASCINRFPVHVANNVLLRFVEPSVVKHLGSLRLDNVTLYINIIHYTTLLYNSLFWITLSDIVGNLLSRSELQKQGKNGIFIKFHLVYVLSRAVKRILSSIYAGKKHPYIIWRTPKKYFRGIVDDLYMLFGRCFSVAKPIYRGAS